MNTSRTIFASAALMALAGSGMIAASPSAELGQEPRRMRHKPSGNTPVSGGGARERERQMARMATPEPEVFIHVTPKCDHEWSGPEVAFENGSSQSCAKCGMLAIDHDSQQ